MAWLVLLILVIVLFLIICPVQFEFEYKITDGQDCLQLGSRVAGILVYHLNIPQLVTKINLKLDVLWQNFFQGRLLSRADRLDLEGPLDAVNNFLQKLPAGLGKYFIKLVFSLINDESNLLRKIHLQRWQWVTKIGVTNPALTGPLTGALWMIKYSAYRYVTQKTAGVTTVPNFVVKPNFFYRNFELELHCIFAFRGGHIITAIIRKWWLGLSARMRG